MESETCNLKQTYINFIQMIYDSPLLHIALAACNVNDGNKSE